MTALISALPYIQIILAILIIALVLMQRSEAGVGGSFGGGDNWNSAHHTRRGFEKFLFNATIIVGILFAIASLSALFLR
ncbi:MAG: preprotein translocase subunit SecG [Candidatus Paceibacterota bacterium]|jgi:preprotein translocase subunit SecG